MNKKPKRKKNLSGYPENWKEIAKRIKDAAGWKCERCKEPHRKEGAFVLTVHHLDGDKSNCADWNLAALCQRCHLAIQGRVKMNQLFFHEIINVSDWFKPHLEGFLRAKLLKDQNRGIQNPIDPGDERETIAAPRRKRRARPISGARAQFPGA